MASNSIPVYSDELSFAEDLVTYTFRYNTEMRLTLHSKRRAASGYVGLDDTMKAAVDFIQAFVDVDSDFTRFKEENWVNGETYKMFAGQVRKLCFREGFETEFFLYYSTYIAALAECFYDAGVLEAPMLAVQFISEEFCSYDMLSVGWRSLNTVAEKFASMAAIGEELNIPILTPPESDDEMDIPTRTYPQAIEETDPEGEEADSEGSETDPEGEEADSEGSETESEVE